MVHSIESFPIQVTTLCTNSFIFFGSCSNVAPLPHSKSQKIEVSFQKSCFRTWFRVDQKQINAMNLVFHAKLAVPAVPDFPQSALSGPLKVPPPSKWMGGPHFPCLVPPVLACFTGVHWVCQRECQHLIVSKRKKKVHPCHTKESWILNPNSPLWYQPLADFTSEW